MERAGAVRTLRDRLADLIGADAVSDDAETLAIHSKDKWFASTLPDVAVFATSTEMVSKVLRFANENGIPVTPRGAGVGYVGGCVPARRGIALSLARMNRIKEIHPADGVAVVEPGVITGVLQAAARERGLFYPPDPASLKECSLGGNIATNAGGPRCLKYGVTRNYILGLEVVLANGDILRTGGRTHKNKTGFDLIGMFVGSEGLLGVVTEATLRLLPFPPARAVLSASFPALQQASDAVQRILAAGYLPAALEVADAFTLNAARQHLGQSIVPEGEGHLLVEIDGQPDSVKGEAAALAQLLRSNGALHLREAHGDEEGEKLWELRRKFSESLKRTSSSRAAAWWTSRNSRPVSARSMGSRSPVSATRATATSTRMSWPPITTSPRFGKKSAWRWMSFSRRCSHGAASSPASTESVSRRCAGGPRPQAP
jgi:glycolate oxidase